MDFGARRGSGAAGVTGASSSSAGPYASFLPDDHRSAGLRYADRRGRTGGIDGSMLNFNIGGNHGGSRQSDVLYPGTSKLRGGLLTSLIQTPGLDPNFVQRFQNIAIIAQLADSILAVAQATGKCIVPVDADLTDLELHCAMNEDGEVCQRCQARAQAAKDEKARNKGKTMRKVKEVLKEDREPEEKGQPTAAGPTETSIPAEEPGPSEIFPVGSLPQELPVSPFSVPRNKTPLPDVSTGAIIAPQLLSILPHINTPNISHKYTTETEIEPLDITEKTEDSHVQKTAESSPNSSAVESTLNTTD